MESDARRGRGPRRRLVALHQRARLALRRGDLAAAAGDNAEARSLAAAIGDRLEIGELWLEDGDRAACEGDREAARQAWEHAAAGPRDRCETRRARPFAPGRARLAAGRCAAGGGARTRGHRAHRGCAESGGDVGAVVGAARSRGDPAGACATGRAMDFERAGAPGLADLLEDGKPRVLREALRGLRDAVAGALVGDGHGGPRALGSLGLEALALRDGDGRELVRFEREAGRCELAAWRPLEAGGASVRARAGSGRAGGRGLAAHRDARSPAVPCPARGAGSAPGFRGGLEAARARHGGRVDGGAVSPARAIRAAAGDRV